MILDLEKLDPNIDLKIFRGRDYKVNDNISIHQPTLDEIYEYGESEYYSLVHLLTSVGADLKWQLDDIGVDYTKVDDWELFRKVLINGLTPNQTRILFGDLDLSKYVQCVRTETNEIVLYDASTDSMIDELTYLVIVDVLRRIHSLKRNDELPANESTRIALIEDARDEYLANKNKKKKSTLKNLISTMVNMADFKYNHETVYGLKINQFMDSVKRIGHIKNAQLLLQSGYSGFGVNLKEINNKELDWMGEI